MPANLVKTRADETKWNKAKKIVRKEYGQTEGKWPVVTHIFENMKKHASAGFEKRSRVIHGEPIPPKKVNFKKEMSPDRYAAFVKNTTKKKRIELKGAVTAWRLRKDKEKLVGSPDHKKLMSMWSGVFPSGHEKKAEEKRDGLSSGMLGMLAGLGVGTGLNLRDLLKGSLSTRNHGLRLLLMPAGYAAGHAIGKAMDKKASADDIFWSAFNDEIEKIGGTQMYLGKKVLSILRDPAKAKAALQVVENAAKAKSAGTLKSILKSGPARRRAAAKGFMGTKIEDVIRQRLA